MSEPFSDYGLQRELVDHWQSRRTGVLSVEIGGYPKSLFIRDGIVQFASSDSPEDKLTQVLINQGRFTEDQLAAVTDNFREDISVGRNLIEMGLITQQELAQGGKEQVYQIFESLMHAESGSRDFEEGPLPQGAVSLPLKAPDAFYRAIMAFDDKAWISSQFGDDLDFVPSKVEDRALEAGRLEDGERIGEIYALIDGDADFNHLAFEVEVDDFQLLKVLYALMLMGHIRIEALKDDGAPVPEPDPDEVRSGLDEAMARSEELARMGEPGMDETVQLPKEMVTEAETGEEPGANMDVTMEIAKDALPEPGPEPEPETGEEPESPIAEAPEPEPGEQGLDDLGASATDLLTDELTRMEETEPTREQRLDGVIMPDPGDEDEDEESAPEDPSERRRRLLILGSAAILVLAGYLMLAQPHLALARYLPGPDPQAPSLDEEPALLDEESEKPAATASTPEPAVTESNADAGSDAVPETRLADSETQPREPATDPEPTPATTETPTAEMSTEGGRRRSLGFRSPVAEGWDPSTGRPAGESTGSRRDSPEVVVRQTSPPESTGSGEQNEPTASSAPPRESAAEPDGTEERVTRVPDRREPSGTGSDPTERADPADLLAAGRYGEAARTWREDARTRPNRYTLLLHLLCETGSLRDMVEGATGDPRFFIVPASFDGRACYRVCWGDFDSYREAMVARDRIPEGLIEERKRAEAMPLRVILE